MDCNKNCVIELKLARSSGGKVLNKKSSPLPERLVSWQAIMHSLEVNGLARRWLWVDNLFITKLPSGGFVALSNGKESSYELALADLLARDWYLI